MRPVTSARDNGFVNTTDQRIADLEEEALPKVVNDVAPTPTVQGTQELPAAVRAEEDARAADLGRGDFD